MKIIFGAEAYNLFSRPNFAVPSNTQSPLISGGSAEAVLQDATRDLAKNVGRIFTTVGTGRQSKDSTLESCKRSPVQIALVSSNWNAVAVPLLHVLSPLNCIIKQFQTRSDDLFH